MTSIFTDKLTDWNHFFHEKSDREDPKRRFITDCETPRSEIEKMPIWAGVECGDQDMCKGCQDKIAKFIRKTLTDLSEISQQLKEQKQPRKIDILDACELYDKLFRIALELRFEVHREDPIRKKTVSECQDHLNAISETVKTTNAEEYQTKAILQQLRNGYSLHDSASKALIDVITWRLLYVAFSMVATVSLQRCLMSANIKTVGDLIKVLELPENQEKNIFEVLIDLFGIANARPDVKDSPRESYSIECYTRSRTICGFPQSSEAKVLFQEMDLITIEKLKNRPPEYCRLYRGEKGDSLLVIDFGCSIEKETIKRLFGEAVTRSSFWWSPSREGEFHALYADRFVYCGKQFFEHSKHTFYTRYFGYEDRDENYLKLTSPYAIFEAPGHQLLTAYERRGVNEVDTLIEKLQKGEAKIIAPTVTTIPSLYRNDNGSYFLLTPDPKKERMILYKAYDDGRPLEEVKLDVKNFWWDKGILSRIEFSETSYLEFPPCGSTRKNPTLKTSSGEEQELEYVDKRTFDFSSIGLTGKSYTLSQKMLKFHLAK
ncbi:MAG: hypothetical protein H7A37_04230 [Chlamydiales bacterium]|nr:hypothetical protein [Chlamydiales bacterium]